MSEAQSESSDQTTAGHRKTAQPEHREGHSESRAHAATHTSLLFFQACANTSISNEEMKNRPMREQAKNTSPYAG